MIDRHFQINSATHLYAVIGSPVSHSLSPRIHNAAFENLQLNARYAAFDILPSELVKALQAAGKYGFKGLNVTVPLKESIIPLLDEVDPTARAIGAVNTIALKAHQMTGYNTDAKGFADSLTAYRKRLAGTHVLVLGAGGAARAVIYSLLYLLNVSAVTIVNRTFEKAQRLADSFPAEAVKQSSLDTVDPRNFSMIVNTTPVGLTTLDSPIDTSFFKDHHIAYDLIYSPPVTKYLTDAKRRGAVTINGLNMLIAQAAASFEIWTGHKMPIDEIRMKLDAETTV